MKKIIFTEFFNKEYNIFPKVSSGWKWVIVIPLFSFIVASNLYLATTVDGYAWIFIFFLFILTAILSFISWGEEERKDGNDVRRAEKKI